MAATLIPLPCTLVQGHQIASGTNPESPYPEGSVVMQFPLFEKLGLPLTGFHPATLNLSIAPACFKLVNADFRFDHLTWAEGFHPETFSLVNCKLGYNHKQYPAYVYYPHPETKTRDFHSMSLIEVIAPLIEDIQYGDRVTLHYDPVNIQIHN